MVAATLIKLQGVRTIQGGEEAEALVRVRRVSNHTEVNLRVVIHRYIDLFLGLGGPAIVLWRMVVRYRLHGLLNQLVTLVFELFAVSVFSSVDTPAMVVILGGG